MYNNQYNPNQNQGYPPQNQNQGQGQQQSKYLRTSSLKKSIVIPGQINPQTGKPQKNPAGFAPNQTEEIAFTFTEEKTHRLIAELQQGLQQSQAQGASGVRVVLYCQQHQRGNQTFDGANVLVQGKFPPRNQNQGNFNPNGGGFRQYPPPQSGMSQGQAPQPAQGPVPPQNPQQYTPQPANPNWPAPGTNAPQQNPQGSGQGNEFQAPQGPPIPDEPPM